MPFMKRQFLTFVLAALALGVAALAGAIGGGVPIYVLMRHDPMPGAPRPNFGDSAMHAEGRPHRSPGPPQPRPDPLAQNLFPPELIMRFQAQIGLSDEQRQAIMGDMQQAQPKFEQVQQQLQQAQAALGLMLEKERVELEPVLAQSDKVQNLEREMRRTHLTLLIGLKNRLTAEQQAMLREIKTEQRPEGFGARPPRALQEKMQRLQAGIQQWQQSGRDPSPIGRAMQEFHPLIEAGQFHEAEVILDDALKLLAEENKPR